MDSELECCVVGKRRMPVPLEISPGIRTSGNSNYGTCLRAHGMDGTGAQASVYRKTGLATRLRFHYVTSGGRGKSPVRRFRAA